MDIIFGFLMLGALAMPNTFPPYKGEDAYGHQGWWNGGGHWWDSPDQPHRCVNDGTTPRRLIGKKVCGGVHYRYYLAGHGYVGGYGEGNDPCRANPWDRQSAWICR